MADDRIPISAITLARLQELARWAGVSIDEALDRAIKDQYDRNFWAAVGAGYAALRADPQAWAEIEAERKLWDNTLPDGRSGAVGLVEATNLILPSCLC
jgi:hypothetical protein